MNGRGHRQAVAVPWDEAREILSVVLLVAVALHTAAPMIRFIGQERSYPLWDGLYGVLANVDAVTGVLLLGAAVAVCTTPAADVVPRLRKVAYTAALIVVALGVLSIINVLSVASAGDTALMRIALIAWRPAPAE